MRATNIRREINEKRKVQINIGVTQKKTIFLIIQRLKLQFQKLLIVTLIYNVSSKEA